MKKVILMSIINVCTLVMSVITVFLGGALLLTVIPVLVSVVMCVKSIGMVLEGAYIRSRDGSTDPRWDGGVHIVTTLSVLLFIVALAVLCGQMAVTQ